MLVYTLTRHARRTHVWKTLTQSSINQGLRERGEHRLAPSTYDHDYITTE